MKHFFFLPRFNRFDLVCVVLAINFLRDGQWLAVAGLFIIGSLISVYFQRRLAA